MANILTEFFIKFSSNAKEVTKDQDDASASGVKLQENINKTSEAGVKSAKEMTKANSELGRGIQELKEKFTEFGHSVVEQTLEVIATYKSLFAVEHLIESAFEQAEVSDQLGETAKSLGVNVEQLDAWGNAVQRVGGTASGFQSSLEQLNFGLERLALTGRSRALPFFRQLGINVRDANGHVKNAFELLPQLSKAIEGMPKTESGSILRGIGLDSGTIRLLQSGSKEVDELLEKQKELGNITQADADAAEAYNRQLMDTKQLWRGIVLAVDTAILPAIKDILEIIDEFIEFLREHKDLVVGFFIAMGVAALWAAGTFGLLDAALAVISSAAFWLIAIIGGLIIAFAFLYDDVVNFLEGNNSMIGELAKKWPIIGDIVRGIASAFSSLKEGAILTFQGIVKAIQTVIDFLPNVGKAITVIEDQFSAFGHSVVAIWDDIKKSVMSSIQGIVDAYGKIKGLIPDSVKHVLGITPEAPAPAATGPRPGPNLFGLRDKIAGAEASPSGQVGASAKPDMSAWELHNSFAKGKSILGDATAGAPLMSQTSNSMSAANTNSKTTNVTVQGGPTTINTQASDPVAIKKVFDDHQSEQYKNIVNDQYANGVSY